MLIRLCKFLTALLCWCGVAGSVKLIPLSRFGLHYGLSLTLSAPQLPQSFYPVLIDTGSSDYFIFPPYDTAKALVKPINPVSTTLGFDGPNLVYMESHLAVKDNTTFQLTSGSKWEPSLVSLLADKFDIREASGWTIAGLQEARGWMGLLQTSFLERYPISELLQESGGGNILQVSVGSVLETLQPNPAFQSYLGLSVDGQVGDAVWSEEPSSFESPNGYTFQAYEMSVCGTSIMANTSSHWPALVDSSATCLSLPGKNKCNARACRCGPNRLLRRILRPIDVLAPCFLFWRDRLRRKPYEERRDASTTVHCDHPPMA